MAADLEAHSVVIRAPAEDSVLRDDITVEEAGDVLCVLCSFETFDALYTSRGNSIDETIEMITSTAEHTLCRPAA